MIFDNQGIFGFDISKWQRIPEFNGQPAKEVDFRKMKESGASFVIIKAGQLNYADPGFYYNWEAASEAGIPRGSYWFEDFRESPTAQARKYWSLIKDDVGEGICAMDFEGGSHSDLNSAYLFLNEFQQLSGLPDHKIAIYTGYPYWTNARNNAQRSWFKKFVLWEAWYPDEFNNYGVVRVPSPWDSDECRIWQNATPAIGLAVGVHSREIDHNFFNGGNELFKLYFGENSVPPPTQGENMWKVWSTTDTMTLRMDRTVNATRIVSIPVNTIMLADRIEPQISGGLPGDKWAHVTEVIVNGVAYGGWVAIIHNGTTYCRYELIPEAPTQNIVVDVIARDVYTTGDVYAARGIRLTKEA